MKLIKFLLRSVVFMFFFLFLLFFVYIYNDNKTVENEPEFVEVIQDKIEIEPTVISKEVEEQEVLSVEPATNETPSNKEKRILSSNKFYYTNLDEYSKLIYEGLDSQKENLKTGNARINLSSKIGEAIEAGNKMEEIFSAGVNAFEHDNPDLYYLDASKMILYYERDYLGKYKIYLKCGDEYNSYLLDGLSKEQIQSAQEQIDIVVQGVLDATINMNNDYDKILYVHDWLANNIKYDETIMRTNKDTIYGAFVEGEAVCTGYAKAFKYLMDRLNINTIIVQGIGINEQGQENHTWNYVELNGKWYGIDCTWDDPIIIGDLTYYTERKYYTYFLKGQNVFFNDHKQFETFYGTDLKINYPELNVEDY